MIARLMKMAALAGLALAACAFAPAAKGESSGEGVEASFEFASDGRFLPLGQARLPFESCGVTNLQVTLYKSYDNNYRPFGLSAISSKGMMREVANRKITLPPPYDVKVIGMLDLNTIGESALEPGGYLVEVKTDAKRKTWWGGTENIEASRNFMLGNMGVVAVTGMNGCRTLAVAVNSLKDGRPVAGAKVSVITRANQIAAFGEADEAGFVRLTLDYDFKGDELESVIVRKDGDVSQLILDYRNSEISQDAYGTRFTEPNAYLFAARDIVRPGETYGVQALVRNSLKSGYRPLANAPVDVVLRDCRGNLVAKDRLTTDETGYVAAKWDIPANAPTGSWRVELKTGANDTAGSCYFRVAAYQPDRVKVGLGELKPLVGFDAECMVDWSAKYYFGPDAQAGSWSAWLHFNAAANPSHWRGWTCNIPGSIYIRPMNYNGDLADKERQFRFTGIPENDRLNAKPIRVEVSLDVAPEGERTVSASGGFTVFPRTVYAGLREAKGDHGKKTIELAALPAIAGEFPQVEGEEGWKWRLSLVRYEWKHHYVRRGNLLQSEWSEDEFPHPELDRTVEIAPGTELKDWIAKIAWDADALESGKWVLTVYDGDEAIGGMQFWHSKGETGEKMVSAAALDFDCDKPKYVPGETAVVSFKSPFDGMAYVAAGWMDLENSFSLPVVRGKNSFVLPVPADLKGKCYHAAVTLVTAGEPKMRRMSGTLALPVDVSAAKLGVEVESVKVVVPGIPSQVKVRVTDSDGRPVKGKVQVMATDEGVLALTDFDTPDPFAAIFNRNYGRPFKVYDMYSAIYPDLQILPNGEFGGGLAKARMADRQRKDGTLKERKTATFTLAPVDTDENGEASVLLPAAEFTGLLRVMAVAWTDDAAGSGEDDLIVREKASAWISAPRFAAPGDEFEISAVAFNNDLPETDWELAVTWPGAGKTFTGRFAKGDEKAMQIQVKLPANFTGEWKAEGVLRAGNVVSRDSATVAVRPVNPAETEVTYLIDSGHGFYMPPAENDWIDCEESYEDFDTPAATLKGALDWLNDYPYGCLEQTCAKAFPFLAADDLKELGLIDETARTGAVERVEGAYGDILAMRNSDGSFGMWPWSDSSWTEASVFAWHLIAEGVAAGYLEKDCCIPKNPSFLKSTATYTLASRLDNAAYACYVLAVMGNDAFLVPARNIVADEKASDSAKFLAAAALVRGGYRNEGEGAMKKALAARFWNKTSQFGGIYASRASQLGRTLFISARAGIEPELLAPLMAELNRMIRRDKSAWGTTSDNAWAAVGLAAAGVRCKAANPEGFRMRRLTRIGIRKNPSPPRNAIKVTRRFVDRDGNERMTFQKGELATVVIDFDSPRDVDNAVIAALVPGGFEIEDSALKTRASGKDAKLEGDDARATPGGMSDIRDDRWLWFGSFYERYDGKGYRVKFKIRAVNRGVFNVPCVSIEDMYNPDVAGDVPGKGVIVVE